MNKKQAFIAIAALVIGIGIFAIFNQVSSKDQRQSAQVSDNEISPIAQTWLELGETVEANDVFYQDLIAENLANAQTLKSLIEEKLETGASVSDEWLMADLATVNETIDRLSQISTHLQEGNEKAATNAMRTHFTKIGEHYQFVNQEYELISAELRDKLFDQAEEDKIYSFLEWDNHVNEVAKTLENTDISNSRGLFLISTNDFVARSDFRRILKQLNNRELSLYYTELLYEMDKYNNCNECMREAAFDYGYELVKSGAPISQQIDFTYEALSSDLYGGENLFDRDKFLLISLLQALKEVDDQDKLAEFKTQLVAQVRNSIEETEGAMDPTDEEWEATIAPKIRIQLRLNGAKTLEAAGLDEEAMAFKEEALQIEVDTYGPEAGNLDAFLEKYYY